MLKREEKSLLVISILLLVFIRLPSVFSQIALGSRLSVEAKSRWVSTNGDFAIGFFDHLNEYGIGIRISSGLVPVEKQPIVWVAGADLRVGDRSYFELSENGELVLFDSMRGVVVWASNSTDSGVNSAVLRDDGNLVLLKSNKEIVWQSFDTPSDTLLPGQNLSAFHVLRAASRNSVSSFYSLRIGTFGDLELKWENDVVYWRSTGTASGSRSSTRAVLDSDGALQLFDKMSSRVWSVFGQDHGEPDVEFRILRLDVDGNLRLYSWTNDSTTSWRLVWQAVENQCDVFATCGSTGICAFNESGLPVCKCPFSISSVPSSKCLLPYQQGCKSGSYIVKLDHTSLYAIYPPNETIVSEVSSAQCQRLCQDDRLCTAATFVNDGTAKCRIKKTQYVSGQLGSSVTAVSFVKRCNDPVAVIPSFLKPATPSQNAPPRKEDTRDGICVSCVVGVGGGTIIVFVVIHFALMGFWVYRRRRSRFVNRNSSTRKGDRPETSVFLALSYDEVKDVTEEFKHRIGESTFKGVLPPENQPVVVKDYSALNVDPRKFRHGVLKLGSIHHKNLVRLEGYCCDSSHRFLVFEFLKNGSLETCLEDPAIRKHLTWNKRLDLCLAVARALSYLHMGCREFVGHGSLSCKNVVLDENFEAKVTEFGLGNFLGDGSGVGARDILDFGTVVLAVVSGDPKADGGCDWAYEKWAGGDAVEIVDKTMDGGVDGEALERVLRIMFWCFQRDERMRPPMGEIVNVLEGAVAVDPPPPPNACRKTPWAEEDDGGGSGSGSEG